MVTETLSLKGILDPLLPKLDLVQEKLDSIGKESEGILKESSEYILSGSGKRLRASLVLFCSSLTASSSQNGRKHFSPEIEIAAAVELIHSATLVHDDIIDRAVLRRLKPTVNLKFGDDMAVLLGDFLYSRAFEMISIAGDKKIVECLAQTTRIMCEGEIDQLKHRFRAGLSLEEYLSFIERKTASLISSCARSGACLAGLPLKEEESLASFGLNIGIAYQIVDDLLDIIGSEKRMGKTLHTDSGNGKMTLPSILLLDRLAGEEKTKFLDHLRSPEANRKIYQDLMVKFKIAGEVERFADAYFNKAIHCLESFPKPFKKSLEDLSRFILRRDF